MIAALDGRVHDADVLALARTLQAVLGTELLLAHVIPPPPLGRGVTGYAPSARREGRELLARAAEQSAAATSIRVLETWPAAFALAQLAEDHDASMLVVGSSHRRRIGTVVPGRTASHLVARATCPIAVAPAGYGTVGLTSTVIGLAYDGTSEADLALEAATSAASTLRAPLRVYHVVHDVSDDPSWDLVRGNVQRIAREILDRGLSRVPDAVSASAVILQGDVAERLAESARADHVELLFVGSRGFGPVHEALVGGVVGGLLDIACCPLVIVPARHAGDEVEHAPDGRQDRR